MNYQYRRIEQNIREYSLIQFEIVCQINKRIILLMECFGARNTRGFSSQIQMGHLPDTTHITYEGIFNQIKYDVGPKTQKVKDLHIGFARYQFPDSAFDPSIHDYLALFLKGKKDGEERDERPINAMICLDISGSMSGGLGEYNYKINLSRLQLSVEAIKMFISRLRPNDSVGLITFNNIAHVIFTPIFKRDFDDKTFDLLDKIAAGGGTTIKSGFSKSKELLSNWIIQNQCQNCQNRIIMLTDVGDNSIPTQKQFIEKASIESNINLTIIGISNEFRSQTCETLKNVKGFNYFCAINQDDIKKYVFETFDFGFFPSAYDVYISVKSHDIKSFQVFGAPDSDKVAQYNDNFMGNPVEFVITKVKSTFPSQIEIIGEKVHTYGGLILIKLDRKTKQPFFKGEITLQFRDPFGKFYEQKYQLNYQFHPEEQFMSDQCLREAIEGFTFTSEMKRMLELSKNEPNKQLFAVTYEPLLCALQLITPKSKLKDLQNIQKIIRGWNKEVKPNQQLEEQIYEM